MADVARVLGADDGGVGVRDISPSVRDALDEDVLRRVEPDADERHASLRGDGLERAAVVLTLVDGVHDDGVALPQDAASLLRERVVHAARDVEGVARRVEVLVPRNVQQLLTDGVAPQHEGAGHRADVGREPTGYRRLAGAAESANPDEARRRRGEQPLGQREVLAGGGVQALALTCLLLQRRGRGARLRAHGRPARQEQRQQLQPLPACRRVEIRVEHHVGMPRQLAAPQVHQQERQVVEDVDARDGIVELHAVERRGFAVEQDDVAQVQVAMAVPHESCLAPRLEQGAMTLERRA